MNFVRPPAVGLLLCWVVGSLVTKETLIYNGGAAFGNSFNWKAAAVGSGHGASLC